MNASPAKRRALAALDANAPSPGSKTPLKHVDAAPVPKPLPSPPPEEDASKKRPPPAPPADEQPAKKACRDSPGPEPPRGRVEALQRAELRPEEGGEDRTPAASPAPSSLFDSSGIDTSQATTLTESDADGTLAALLAAGPPPARRVLTREESRQKAEVLRLRLSLASYKLKTGQADVPLDQLQVRPLPGAAARAARTRTPLPSGPGRRTAGGALLLRTASGLGLGAPPSSASSSPGDSDRNTSDSGGSAASSAAASPEKPSLPRLHPAAAFTPHRKRVGDDERLTSSALRDGAASGLLRLSLARS